MPNEPETYGGVLIKNIRLPSRVFISTFSLPHNNMYEKKEKKHFCFYSPFSFLSLSLSLIRSWSVARCERESVISNPGYFLFLLLLLSPGPAAIKLWQIAHSRQTLRTNKGRSREMEGKLAFSLERPPILFWYPWRKKKSSSFLH